MNLPQWLLDLMEGARVLWGGITQQAESNPVFRIVLYLIGACILILILMWLFQPSPRQEKMKESRRRGVYGHASAQPNPTNGLEYALFGYPVVYRLTGPDGDAGEYLKKTPGPEALLRLGEKAYKVLVLSQLTEKAIEEIQHSLLMRGKIPFQGEEWDLDQELSLNVEVVAGTPPNFPGKVGMIDYKIASRGEGEEKDLILLENPYIPNKPSKLLTWTGSLLEEISLEEFAALSKEILEETPAGK